MDAQRRLRAYTPPRLTLAGSICAVTALSGAPTPTIPPVMRTALTTTATSAGGSAVSGAVDERLALASGGASNQARPKMPKTGRGGQAGATTMTRPLGTPIAALTLAAGLAATADDWGRARRSRRDCWRLYAPPGQDDQSG